MQFWLFISGYFFSLFLPFFRVFYSISNQIIFLNELKSPIFFILDMNDEQTIASAMKNLKRPDQNPETSVDVHGSSPKPKMKNAKLF